MSRPVQVMISQWFAVPAERTFDAWLDPEKITRWLADSHGHDERIVRLDLEPRVGGKFSFVIERQGVEINHVGEYLELDSPGLLVFTWGTGDSRPATRRVIVEIAPRDGGCELTLTHVTAARSTVFADKAADVWRAMLAEMAGALPGKTNSLILKAS